MMAGAGLMVGPLVVSACIDAGVWIVAPATFFAVSLLLLALSSRTYLPIQPASQLPAEQKFPYREAYFWLMMLISFLYALSEATFSNWAVIFLNNTKGFSVTEAGTGLAAFWGGLTIGRLLTAFVVLKLQPYKVWLIFPVLMAGAFFVVPRIDTPVEAIASFAFAGLACSAFFPLMVAVGSSQYPYAISWLASMLTAALMLGVGVGSYAVGALIDSFPLERIYYVSAICPAVTLLMILFTRRFENRVFNRDSL
jgi:fucose permease